MAPRSSAADEPSASVASTATPNRLHTPRPTRCQAPVAAAGGDMTVTDNDGNGQESFTLDGSASIDPGGGTIVSYNWSEGGLAVGSGQTLNLARSIGGYTFTLTVTDQVGLQSSDSVNVTAVANQPPTADAGGDNTPTDNACGGSAPVHPAGRPSAEPAAPTATPQASRTTAVAARRPPRRVPTPPAAAPTITPAAPPIVPSQSREPPVPVAPAAEDGVDAGEISGARPAGTDG